MRGVCTRECILSCALLEQEFWWVCALKVCLEALLIPKLVLWFPQGALGQQLCLEIIPISLIKDLLESKGHPASPQKLGLCLPTRYGFISSGLMFTKDVAIFPFCSALCGFHSTVLIVSWDFQPSAAGRENWCCSFQHSVRLVAINNPWWSRDCIFLGAVTAFALDIHPQRCLWHVSDSYFQLILRSCKRTTFSMVCYCYLSWFSI